MLATTLLWQPGHQFLLRHVVPSPPSIIRPRIRAFHASASRNDPLDVFLYLPHEMLQYLHVALPWYAAIPVSAFIMRGLLVSTIGSYSRSLTSRYVALNPLRHAISLQIRDREMRKGRFTNPQQAQRAISLAIRKETSALDKRWNCTLRGQIGWTVLQLPLFLMMAEIIRRMSAANNGLLTMGLNALGLRGSSSSDPEASIMESRHASDVAINPWYEASLGNEGFLWFPDLLVPDPSGVLPFLLSGLMFINIYQSSNTAGNVEGAKPWQKGLRRSMLGVALLIGPIGQAIPASLMLYWASSTSSVMLWNVWLDWKYPILQGWGPCKRPLLLMPPRVEPRTHRQVRR